MAKIYNEIVIDMNPESSTFEEVLHEDSFEYSGDMMLAQDEGGGGAGSEGGGDTGGTPAQVILGGAGREWNHDVEHSKYSYKIYNWDEAAKKYVDSGEKTDFVKDADRDTLGYPYYATESEANAKQVKGEDTDWGAANITKDMFISTEGSQYPSASEHGKPRSIQEIYTTLDPLLPNMTGEKLKLQIRDMLPKYEGVSEEEKGFAREGFQKDVYGISKDAAKAGQQMQQAYGSGMGSQMRGAIAGQKDVSQQFKQAEQGYAQDVYGLEKKAGAEFETGVADWLQSDWFTTPEGDTDQTTAWDDFREGGKVPTKEETFLDVLSRLPDAGGS